MSDTTASNHEPHRIMLAVAVALADVATERGCGRDTVYALIASGVLRSVLVGERLRRIRRGDLLAHVEGLAPARLRSDHR